MKDFYDKVYDIVGKIPRGKVTTYGLIGKAIGLKSSARMVGWALSAGAGKAGLPFHRVVNRKGELTGKMHFTTPYLMKELLESEGVKFNQDAVDMTEHLWDPNELTDSD